jgi:aminopeptidase
MARSLLKDYDVILIPITKSLSWTTARKDATNAGARVASMPGITEDVMERSIDIPYADLEKTNSELARKLNLSQSIEVTSPSGTELKLSVKGRRWFSDSGIYDKPGKWGNLPSGEVAAAPVEGTTNGTMVVDASMGGIGGVKAPIRITIKDGFAVEIKGGKEAKELKKMLDSIKSKNAFNIGELGIGTNPRAKVTGTVLEDEKVLGTCHIALGNSALGGNVKVPIHVDGVIKKPTIKVDGKTILKDGEIF